MQSDDNQKYIIKSLLSDLEKNGKPFERLYSVLNPSGFIDDRTILKVPNFEYNRHADKSWPEVEQRGLYWTKEEKTEIIGNILGRGFHYDYGSNKPFELIKTVIRTVDNKLSRYSFMATQCAKYYRDPEQVKLAKLSIPGLARVWKFVNACDTEQDVQTITNHYYNMESNWERGIAAENVMAIGALRALCLIYKRLGIKVNVRDEYTVITASEYKGYHCAREMYRKIIQKACCMINEGEPLDMLIVSPLILPDQVHLSYREARIQCFSNLMKIHMALLLLRDVHEAIKQSQKA